MGEPVRNKQVKLQRGNKRKSILTRSENVSVRLNPKTRYGADLVARLERRTLSSYCEGLVEKANKNTKIDILQTDNTKRDIALNGLLELIWDVEESQRFIRLAFYCSQLLNHDEDFLFSLIKKNGYFWHGTWTKNPAQTEKVGNEENLEGAALKWTWETSLDSVIFFRVKEYWGILNEVSTGEAEPKELPNWIRYKEVK